MANTKYFFVTYALSVSHRLRCASLLFYSLIQICLKIDDGGDWPIASCDRLVGGGIQYLHRLHMTASNFKRGSQFIIHFANI